MPSGEPEITHFAQHSWIDVKLGDEQSWQRVEVTSEDSGVRQTPIGSATARADRRFGDREVRLLEAIEGEPARAIAERVQALGNELDARYSEHYTAYPGPNSNTLLTDLARDTPGLAFKLHHNAVGKDYPGWIDAGFTTSKTGVRLDTLPIGFALGLQEGFELHFLQLTFGLSFWPPRIELPFLPEIPWSSAIETPIVKAPRADHVVTIMDTGHMETVVSEVGIEDHGAWLFTYPTADAWAWLEYASIEPDAEHKDGGFRVHSKSSSSRGIEEDRRVVPLAGNHAQLLDTELEDRRLSLAFDRLPSGRVMPHVEVAGPTIRHPIAPKSR